jgi:predicted transcriptional regulator
MSFKLIDTRDEKMYSTVRKALRLAVNESNRTLGEIATDSNISEAELHNILYGDSEIPNILFSDICFAVGKTPNDLYEAVQRMKSFAQ